MQFVSNQDEKYLKCIHLGADIFGHKYISSLSAQISREILSLSACQGQISGEIFDLSACQGAKNGNFLPHDVVSERLWTAINLGEIPTRNYKAVGTQGNIQHLERLKIYLANH